MQRVVIKLGTSVLTGGTARLDRAHMVEIARQCATLHAEGIDLVLVTSGAVAAGRERLGLATGELPPGWNTITGKQCLAAVGQSRLMRIWEELFDLYQLHVAQLLLSRDDLSDASRRLNAGDTLEALFAQRIIPIVNENDAVATAEIKVGDNDNLSALTAVLAEADLLVLLTDQPGLFTADPRLYLNAELIPEVRAIDQTLHALAGGALSGQGTGGMVTKLQAADTARRSGVPVLITAGRAQEAVLRAVRGEAIGTRFPALETRLEARKQRIYASAPSGAVRIDAGAVRALRERGASLLPAGVCSVTGTFQRGAIIRILTTTGEEVARGMVRYDHQDLKKLPGAQSAEIANRLGYSHGDVIVHRNDLVLK